MQKIILASQSPQRKLLMDALGVEFEVQPADIDEKKIVESDQKLRAQKIALAKAQKVASNLKKRDALDLKNNFQQDYIIIAADTFTMFNGKSYEKPKNLVQAKQMLREQSGQTGVCYSGFAYIDQINKVGSENQDQEGTLWQDIKFNDVAVTKIVFRELSEAEIEKYINENPVLTWSAAFCPAYPAGANLIASVEGSFTSFTHGLPMEMLAPLLKKSGLLSKIKYA